MGARKLKEGDRVRVTRTWEGTVSGPSHDQWLQLDGPFVMRIDHEGVGRVEYMQTVEILEEGSTDA